MWIPSSELPRPAALSTPNTVRTRLSKSDNECPSEDFEKKVEDDFRLQEQRDQELGAEAQLLLLPRLKLIAEEKGILSYAHRLKSGCNPLLTSKDLYVQRFTSRSYAHCDGTYNKWKRMKQ